jgi:hypothetical protein
MTSSENEDWLRVQLRLREERIAELVAVLRSIPAHYLEDMDSNMPEVARLIRAAISTTEELQS